MGFPDLHELYSKMVVIMHIVCEQHLQSVICIRSIKVINIFSLGMYGCNKHREKKKENAAANHLLKRMTSSSQHPPKTLQRLLGKSAWKMANLDVETIEKIQDQDEPSIQGSQNEIIPIQNLTVQQNAYSKKI